MLKKAYGRESYLSFTCCCSVNPSQLHADAGELLHPAAAASVDTTIKHASKQYSH